MRRFLKSLWFLFVFISSGTAWMFCTVLILGQKLRFTDTPESLFTWAVLLPAIVFLSGAHLLWMVQENWLTTNED